MILGLCYLHCLMGFGFCGGCLFWYYKWVLVVLVHGINSVACFCVMVCVIWFSGGFDYLVCGLILVVLDGYCLVGDCWC